jgi:hypothetical protein
VLLQVANVIVAVFEGYVFAGLGFALLFLPRGIARVDHRVAGSPKTLRLLLLPGMAAFWPLFAWRWFSGAAEPVERNAHRAKAAAP